MVWIALFAHPGNTRDVRWLAVGMIEEDEVANLHCVAHHVSRLIISNPIPMGRAIGHELGVRVDIKF